MMAPEIARELRGWRFHYSSERDLQDAIASVLSEAEVDFEREAPLTERDRIDFLAGDVGIEVKVASPVATVLRQLRRYAASDRVRELVLVTNRARHGQLPELIDGKPLIVVGLLEAGL